MAYRLDLTLDPADALRAVAVDQLEDAIAQLQDPKDPVTAVHEARKDLKKVRSLLRLSRTGMKPKARRAANGRFRDIAARLAGARDADVMVATVAALHEKYAGQLPARTFTIIGRRFAQAAHGTAVDPDVITALEAERDAVAEWPVTDVDLAAGIAVAYARGRDEYRAVRKAPDVEALHEWRKRVKDLWYHSRMLEDAWPGPLQALAQEAHVLADLLGDDHDLAVLAERMDDHMWPPSVDPIAFVELCHRRRAELETDAFALGAKLYAERPKAFARRISSLI